MIVKCYDGINVIFAKCYNITNVIICGSNVISLCGLWMQLMRPNEKRMHHSGLAIQVLFPSLTAAKHTFCFVHDAHD
jgi:hypothetical protein